MNNQYQLVKESLIFSTTNIIYNFEEWKKSKDGKLLITGYIGSGKSTLSKDIAKQYNVKIIELDLIPIDKKKFSILKAENKIDELKIYYQNLINSYIDKLLKREEKIIIEGIQIFLYDGKQDLSKYSIIVMGTSTLKSVIRSTLRNFKEKDYKGPWLDILLDIYNNIFIKKVENFIKKIKGYK